MQFQIDNATVLECSDNRNKEKPSNTTALEVMENGLKGKSILRFKVSGQYNLLSGQQVSISGSCTGGVIGGLNYMLVDQLNVKELEKSNKKGGEN